MPPVWYRVVTEARLCIEFFDSHLSMSSYVDFGAIKGDDDESLCPTLSFKQRIIGFVICLGIGMFISVMSFIVLFQQDYTTFGILNTVANIITVLSSLFLAGPLKQLKKMFEETRWIATGIFLLSMILTFVVALVLKIAWLTLICVFIQYLAMTWYGLSYIPFARNAIKRLVGCPT